jgi:hypothetical protein
MAAVDPVLVELWLYLGISIVWVFIRVFSRWKTQTLRGLAVDDYLMVVVIVSRAPHPSSSMDMGASEETRD